jgi:hypothetical protein
MAVMISGSDRSGCVAAVGDYWKFSTIEIMLLSNSTCA